MLIYSWNTFDGQNKRKVDGGLFILLGDKITRSIFISLPLLQTLIDIFELFEN